MLIRTVVLSILFFCCVTLAAASTKVHEYQLDNGLLLLVKEDHRTPLVVSQVWYKVGSSYEPPGITGISHVVEHMMFKGTDKLAPGEFSRIIAANGGRENAFTSRDYTGYYQQLEKSRLKVSFELEADRMRHLNLTEEEFAKEVNVVMEERRLRVEDDPQSVASEQFTATAYVTNAYRTPVIGWMQDLENLELNDLKSWYKTWYAPNNATIVVVGDVDPDEVHALAKKFFGHLKPSNIKKIKPQAEVKQRGIKRITVKAPAQLPLLFMGYHAPSAKTADIEWEPYALEVLAAILDGGESARFTTDLIHGQQVAASTSVGYNPHSRNNNLFTLNGTPSQTNDVSTLENAFREQIKRIQDEPPSKEELQRIQTQVVASAVYEQDSTFYQAMQLGALVSVGLDWRLDNEYVDRIRAVTSEQVQTVARKYLIDDQLTIAVLDPQPLNNNNAKTSTSGEQNAN